MSDTNWREAARLLRQRVISVDQFIEALGEDVILLEELKWKIDETLHWLELCRECEHFRWDHDDRGCLEVIEDVDGVGICDCKKVFK
jgi:hypothetical protein